MNRGGRHARQGLGFHPGCGHCSLLTVKQDDVPEELFESDRAGTLRMMSEAKSFSDTKSHLPAIILYRQVLARDPFHREAMSELTVLLEAIGESEEAARYRNRLERPECSGQRSAACSE